MPKPDAGIIFPYILGYDECAHLAVILNINGLSKKSGRSLQWALKVYQAEIDRQPSIPRFSETRRRLEKLFNHSNALQETISQLHQKDIDFISAADLPKNLFLADKIVELGTLLGRITGATNIALKTLPNDSGGPPKTHGPLRGLIIVLIGIYQNETGKKARAPRDDYSENIYAGGFYRFVEAVFKIANINKKRGKHSLAKDIKGALKIAEGMSKSEFKAFTSIEVQDISLGMTSDD